MQHAASPPSTRPLLILQAQARGRELQGNEIANRATCHSERSEESRSGPPPRKQGEIPRFARNDSGCLKRLSHGLSAKRESALRPSQGVSDRDLLQVGRNHMRNGSFEFWRFRLLILGGVALLSVVTFASPPQQAQESQLPAAAPAAQTSEPEFKLRVQKNVVVVRVVVRDSKGRAVGGLRQEDFRITDNKKPQEVGSFSVETSEAAAGAGTTLGRRSCDQAGVRGRCHSLGAAQLPGLLL